MTVLAAARNTRSRDGSILELPMAVDIVYKGGMVCLNAAGFAAPASDAVDYSRVVGVAFETVDNSSGSAGDINVRLDTGRSFRFTAASIEDADVGRMMYVTDDNIFNDAQGSFAIPAGVLVERESSTVGWIFVPDTNDPVKGDGELRVRHVQITNAQMILARATPVVLIPAPGANKTIIVDRVTFVSDDQGADWTESSDNLVVQYADGVDITGAIEATSLVGQSAVVIESYGVLDTIIIPDVNASVDLFNTGSSEWGGGNVANSMSVAIVYHVIDTVAFE